MVETIIHDQFSSQYVRPRRVDVWLPADYESSPDKDYAVLYMHDGQNLFHSEYAMGGITWGVTEALEKLHNEGAGLKDTIIVGVWNTEIRWDEYLPLKPFLVKRGEKALARINAELENGVVSDQYLKFLVEELKPFIDKTYRTRPDVENTFIMGSSMGGLISLYAICEYPQVFGGAGCVSTHWPAVKTLMRDYLIKQLPDPATHKIYFDYGTEHLDAKYEPHQKRVDAVMSAKAYEQGKNWITRKFEGATHNEASWQARIHIPLTFLLKS